MGRITGRKGYRHRVRAGRRTNPIPRHVSLDLLLGDSTDHLEEVALADDLDVVPGGK